MTGYIFVAEVMAYLKKTAALLHHRDKIIVIM